MYPNLNAEMARLRITRKHVADILGITPSTLSLKLQGKNNLTLKECVKIKNALQVDIPIEELFSPATRTG